MGLPFHSPEEPPGAFASFWVFHLSPHTLPGSYCCFLKVPGQSQPAFSFPSSGVSSPVSPAS